MSIFKKIVLWVVNFLFPQACALCGCCLLSAGEMSNGLCGRCRAALVSDVGEKCNLCGKPLISEIERCLPCRNGDEKSYDRLWVLFPYTGKYRKLLGAYKFKKNLALANFLAEKVIQVIDENPVLEDVCFVPVPPRPGKIKETGWDQVDWLSKKLPAPVRFLRCLKRRSSEIQKRLDRAQRIENMKGRIFHYGKIPETVIVIDDVITTGSTMEVCSKELKSGGAKKVYGLCLFYD